MQVNLVMFKPNGSRKDFPLVNNRTIIGRAESCDLQIPLLSVSRRHCEISIEGDKLTVKDLASSNGTYVNNERINKSEVKAGDRLVIGPVVFTMQVDGEPEEIQQIKTRGQLLAEGSRAGEETPVDLESEIAAGLGSGADDSGAGEMELAETAVNPARSGEETGDADPMSALEAISDEEDDDTGGQKKA